MNWLRNIYFSYDGRFGRRDFWLFSWAMNLVFGLFAAGPVLIARANGYEPTGWNFVVVSLWLLFFWPQAALFVKRGHDRGRPAGWSIAVLITGPVLSLILPRMGAFGLAMELAFTTYILLDYGFLPGTVGANPYGNPDRNIERRKTLVLSN